MNANKLFQRTNVAEPHQQTSRPSIPQSWMKASGVWVGYCTQGYSVKRTFMASRASVKMLSISEKVKSSAPLHPCPFLEPLKNFL